MAADSVYNYFAVFTSLAACDTNRTSQKQDIRTKLIR